MTRHLYVVQAFASASANDTPADRQLVLYVGVSAGQATRIFAKAVENRELEGTLMHSIDGSSLCRLVGVFWHDKQPLPGETFLTMSHRATAVELLSRCSKVCKRERGILSNGTHGRQ